jgi:Protein of unknown function (DUF2510)
LGLSLRLADGTLARAPAGWYPDPEIEGGERYWDGTRWTEQRRGVGDAQPGVEVETTSPGRFQRVLGSRRRRILLAAALSVLLLAVAFAVGVVVGDDSDRVDELENELANTQDDLDSAQAEVSLLETQLAQEESKRRDLAQRLQAELGISGELPTAQASGPGPPADYALGEAGIVGDFIFRPTTFEQTGSSGNEATYVATISVKNDTSEPQDPFCGGDGAAVIDELGRRYGGDSVLADATANCGDSLQPGLTGDNYQMRFTLPADAKPALLEVWGDFFVVDESDAKAWSVG